MCSLSMISLKVTYRLTLTLEAINSLIRVADVESRGIIDSFRGMVKVAYKG